tara:strand:+ start:2500 stop:2808 length:309 start_codon:yes stop_codon:yes gene_type:complete
LEAVAYGLGLLPNDFWTLTFHEFFCIQKGRNDRFEMEQQFEWERVRWLACCNLQPHTKKGQRLTPEKLVKFQWEKSKKEIDLEEQKKKAEYALKKYNKINGE